MEIENATAIVAEDRRSRMTDEGVLLDRLIVAVEQVAEGIPPPSRHAAALFSLCVAARTAHSELRVPLSKEKRG